MRALGVALVALAGLAAGVVTGGLLATALRTGSGAAVYLAAHTAPLVALSGAVAWGLARRKGRGVASAATAFVAASYALLFLATSFVVSAELRHSDSPFRGFALLALLPPWGAGLVSLLAAVLLSWSRPTPFTTVILLGSGVAFVAAVPPLVDALRGAGRALLVVVAFVLLPASFALLAALRLAGGRWTS